MPLRTRAGSSPIRNSAGVEYPSVLISPSRHPGGSRVRRGSLSAVEAIKERARRGTGTSSDLSSDNDVESQTLKVRPNQIDAVGDDEELLEDKIARNVRQNTKESTDLDDEFSGSASDNGSLSSASAGPSEALLSMGNMINPLLSSPTDIPGPLPLPNTSPKRQRVGGTAPPSILPPRQPISKLEAVSILSAAIEAKRSKTASPFETFATLSGKGDPKPLLLKIYAPFSAQPTRPFEVAIRKAVLEDNSWERKISVVDAIGFSLWRYAEESLSPSVAGDKMNVNRWMLRMVEDEEVDYDFPPLDRTKPMADFTSNNNRAARMRSTSNVYDEFALVEASTEQFAENEKLTPNPAKTAKAVEEEVDDDPTPQPSPWPAQLARWNPVLGHDFAGSGSRNNSIIPADLPSAPTIHATPRKGPSKIIKIHLISTEGYAELVALDVTTDTYLAEVLTAVCKKRNLDKAHHILKVSNTNVIAPLDRTLESLGERADLDLVRRRFGNDGSMSNTTPGSTPPNAPLLIVEPPPRKGPGTKKASSTNVVHPLAQANDLVTQMSGSSSSNYKRFTVWRKQPMSFIPAQERIIAIDGDSLHIMPAYPPKSNFFDNNGKASSPFHLSSVVGCRVSRKHPSQFRVVIYKVREIKRYHFQTQSPEDAAMVVGEINKASEPYQGGNHSGKE